MIILRMFFYVSSFDSLILDYSWKTLLTSLKEYVYLNCLNVILINHKQHFFQTCVVILCRKINNNIAHLFCYNFFWVTKTTSSNCRECNGGHVLIFTLLKTGKYESPKKLLIKNTFADS